MADFILEFTNLDLVSDKNNSENPEWAYLVWTLFVDGSSNKNGSGAGVVLQNPLQERITRAFRYEFIVSNNEAEYGALITGLHMAKDLDIKRIMVFCDSQLVVN